MWILCNFGVRIRIRIYMKYNVIFFVFQNFYCIYSSFVFFHFLQGTSNVLAHINLANNLLTEIPFKALSEVKSLQSLDLSQNQIQFTFDVLFQTLLSMDSLNLDLNQIHTLPPYSLQNFGYINRTSLRGNPIERIADDAFKDAKIKELYIHDCNINSLAEFSFRGLETTLHTLDLSYNNLTTLPENIFDNLSALRSLSLSYNKLTLVPEEHFKGFKDKLQHLNLIGYEMGRVLLDSIKELRNIRTLGLNWLPSNALTKEDFVGFGPAVEKLYLINIGISSISEQTFEPVPGVKTLDLSNNQISAISKEAFVNIGGGLEHLRMNAALLFDNIPPEPMKYLVKLKELDVANNALTRIDGDCLRSMGKLRRINLDDNKIRKLSRNSFQGQYHPFLESIQLSFNDIKEIETKTFHGCRALKYVYLDDNKIRKIEKAAFSNLEKLEYVNLEGNNIRDLGFEAFQNIPKLRYLDLSFNELTNFNMDAFEQVGILSSLTIDASHNRMPHLKMNGTQWLSYSSIKMIDFSYNNITWISKDFFESVASSLLHLNFNHNNLQNITALEFSSMTQLQLVDYSYNKIKDIDELAFQHSKRLRSLNFRSNMLVIIPNKLFVNQINLKHIDLAFNFIKDIPDNLFRTTPLEVFRASHNWITEFPATVLEGPFETLRVVDLSYNFMTHLTDSMVGRLSRLVSLDVSHNRLKTIETRAFRSLWWLVNLDISHNPIKVS